MSDHLINSAKKFNLSGKSFAKFIKMKEEKYFPGLVKH